MKKCIFYLPYRLEQGSGARMMRPRKMAEAFREIGYETEMISGVSGERRARIREIRKRIAGGETFDFLYAESHTEPMLLTDPGHLPTHPFLDYGFLRFLKKQGIPIGLFYSDLFWKYDGYGEGLPGWKKRAALMCYRLDLRQYEKLLDRFYVPDRNTFSKALGSEKLTRIMSELPPGAENIPVPGKKQMSGGPLTVFYVGGLGGNYQVAELVKAVYQTEGTRLILCCREAEWEREKAALAPFLCDRVKVIHKNGETLEPEYREADIGSLMFRRNPYMDMARPFKAYEYLGHELPVLATAGTAMGRFAEENGTGWSIDNSADAIAGVLREILQNPAELKEKCLRCAETKRKNLWTSRAEQAAAELTGKV